MIIFQIQAKNIENEQARERGFSLVEVVFAIGIFSFVALILGGVWTSGLTALRNILHSAEAIEMVSGINAILQNKAETSPRFVNAVHEQLSISGNPGVIEFFAYQKWSEENLKELENKCVLKDIALAQKMDMPALTSTMLSVLRSKGSGVFFRVIISASSVNPPSMLEVETDTQTPKILSTSIGDDPIELFRFRSRVDRLETPTPTPYPQGYLALFVRIYRESLPPPTGLWDPDAGFSSSELVLSYDVALTH